MRNATAPLHDRLDAAMAADLLSQQSYGRFLRVQLAARAPIEAWFVARSPTGLEPPPMAALLIDDLVALGQSWSPPTQVFTLPVDADPIGASWALAGSHLGNRAMLLHLGVRAQSIPTAFLADPSMGLFWRRLLARLDTEISEAGAAPAVLAAQGVFEQFLSAASAEHGKLAA